jgi:hypothetical protein
MCYKCEEQPELRNTRYCDDWWDDSPHGGYNADRKLKERSDDEPGDSSGLNGWWYGRNVYDGSDSDKSEGSSSGLNGWWYGRNVYD